MNDKSKVNIEQLISEMEMMQQSKLLACGRRIIPTLTTDDILQPNDFPDLENHPSFRYEEGILEGIRSVQMAVKTATIS